ncbi:hypothetical protein BWI17_08030 [Betaproteobacteria bacterium GR16-43]|nr:hypothetical protein BWI17_08030 [Betaproteobacteria bacterium GR16-43]
MSAVLEGNGARAPLPPWRLRLAAFWRWWSAEILALLPERFSNLSGSTRAPLVALEDDVLIRYENRPSGLAEVSRTPLGSLDPEGRRIAVRNLLAEAGETSPRLRLMLARDEALVRRVSLPLATEENLGQVLAFEMDRLTPFTADTVYFGYRIAARDAVAAKVHVDLAVAPKARVDERVSRLREWGASVHGALVADDVARSASPIDLLPEAQRGDEAKGSTRRIQAGLGIAVVALFLVALVLPIWQKREMAVVLNPQLTKAKAEAEATDLLARDLEKQVADYNFLFAKKHGSFPVLAFIEEATRLLPDSTWVQQFEIRPAGKIREVQFSGETPSASKLIEILEQSTTMKNAALRGSVTRGSIPGTERFLIAAEARPRVLPDAAAVDGAARPAAPAPAATPDAAGRTTPSAPAAPDANGRTVPVPPPAPPR